MQNGTGHQLQTPAGDKHERLDDRIVRAVEEAFRAREKEFSGRVRSQVKRETELRISRTGWGWIKRLITAEAIFLILVITPVGFFYNHVQKTQQRQELAIKETEAELIALAFRIDSIQHGLGQIDGYRTRFETELSDYQAGFIRTLERTADMQGHANTALLGASNALGQIQGVQSSVTALTDSLGRNAHRVDSIGRNVTLLSTEIGSLGRTLEDGLVAGVIYDAAMNIPCDVQATPLRLVLRGVSDSGSSEFDIHHRERSAPLLRSVELGAGESVPVHTDGAEYRVTLLQASQGVLAAPIARFRIQRVR
jgi:hypothetical protein